MSEGTQRGRTRRSSREIPHESAHWRGDGRPGPTVIYLSTNTSREPTACRFKIIWVKTVEQIAPLLWPSLRPILDRVLEGEEFADRALIGQGLTQPSDQHHYLASFVPVRSQGVVIGAAYVVDDVTALKKSEEAIQLCSEFYAILSRTNMAVSRASSTDALYRDVCEVCVSVGKFAFAWIGVPENGRLTKAASAGIDDGYIAESLISLDPESERARGPAGQAFLHGSYVVVNDFLSATITKPWHALAKRVGVNALAAFPIREAGDVVAVLTVTPRNPTTSRPISSPRWPTSRRSSRWDSTISPTRKRSVAMRKRCACGTGPCSPSPRASSSSTH